MRKWRILATICTALSLGAIKGIFIIANSTEITPVEGSMYKIIAAACVLILLSIFFWWKAYKYQDKN